MPNGAMTAMIESLGCESLNRDKVNYYMKQIENNAPLSVNGTSLTSPGPPVNYVDASSSPGVSDLASPSIMSASSEASRTSRKQIDR